VHHHVVAFETWEGMMALLTPARVQLLRHLGTHPARSVRALALDIGRDYSRVHGDVAALEHAGLVVRGKQGVRVTADSLTVDVRLTEPVAA
jgi:predicted transcriptional regulator